MTLLFQGILSFVVAAVLVKCVVFGWIIWNRSNSRSIRRKQSPTKGTKKVIAFFHPYCAAGGGGERVLWKIIEVLGELYEQGFDMEVIIYTIDPPSTAYKDDLIQHAQERFSITLTKKLPLTFVHLNEYSHFLAPSSRFSLLMESLGTMRLAYKAIKMSSFAMPHIFVDTTGYAFTFVVARLLFGCKVLAYVHYPTISTDMLNLVWERRRNAYNHQEYISKSRITTYIKLVYYTAFAVMYGMVGSLSSLTLVNSTWTYNHIQSLWKGAAWRKKIQIVFPPCSVTDFQTNDITVQRESVILSIGQFRPEKDHALQIESMARLFALHPALKKEAKLVLIGSCRGASDQARLAQLQDLTKKLDLSAQVSFVVNQPYSVIQDWLKKASVGIHTMWNEHFGIGIVEMMAAGLIVVAHRSGGPKTDIVVPFEGKPTGFLAQTVDEYAETMYKALTMNRDEAVDRRKNAQASAGRFSDEVFSLSFKNSILQGKILSSS